MTTSDLTYDPPWSFEQVLTEVVACGSRVLAAALEDLGPTSTAAHPTAPAPHPDAQGAPLQELQLRQAGVAALDTAAACDPEFPSATATFRAQLPTGMAALVVDGRATARVPLRCEFCEEAFQLDAAASWDAVRGWDGGGVVAGAALAAT